MGAVASVDEEALNRELAEARTLIEAGEYEAALDRLATAREFGRGNAEAIDEIRGLARTVWRRAPRGSNVTERADQLVRDAIDPRLLTEGEVGPLPTWGSPRSPTAQASALTRVGFRIIGVLLIVFGVLWICAYAAASEWFGWSLDAILAMVFGGGILVLIGVLLLTRAGRAA